MIIIKTTTVDGRPVTLLRPETETDALELERLEASPAGLADLQDVADGSLVDAGIVEPDLPE